MKEINLDEFIQLGYITQDLPSVKKEKIANAYYSFVGINSDKVFSKMVRGLEDFKRNKSVGPIIIYFTKKDRKGGHGVLAYDYEDYEDKTIIYRFRISGTNKDFRIEEEQRRLYW